MDPSPTGKVVGRSHGSASGKRCVVFGCSNTNKDGVSLHFFPFKNNDLLKKWNLFVSTKRKNWGGATKHSVVCSKHFLDSCYPTKYKIMESLGQVVRRKDLLSNAVPTINTVVPSPITETPPPPKKPRMAFTKRENARILSQHFKDEVKYTETSTEPMEMDHEVDRRNAQGTDNDMMCIMESDDQTTPTSSKVAESSTRTYGCQVGLKKPPRRSKKIQTSFRTHDKVCQTPSIECKSVAIQCDILKPEEHPINKNTSDDDSLSFGDTEDIADPDVDDQEHTFDSSFNASFLSNTDDDDVESDSNTDERDDQRDRKFVVYQSQLLQLFSACPRCSSPTFGHIQQICGTAVKVLHDCGFCPYYKVWRSQPMIGSIPAGNLLLSCAILFSGSLPSKSLRMLKFMNVATVSYDTFLQHQKHYLQPAIMEVWNEHKQSYLDSVIQENREVTLGGDGRADTPGHSAKYGSYTMMDLDESRVIDVQLVQSNEVKSSYHMEKEGLVRSVQRLTDAGIVIHKIVTDRHVQILKWVRENMPTTKHCVDIWHVAKGLKKKLTAVSKEKDCEVLVPWIKSISNHLYWVAASTPSADPSLMMEKWLSVANHVQNIHEGHGSQFEKCSHGDLSGRERRKKWINPATKVSERLDDVILSRQMKKDIPMLSTGQQTSSIEAYHSVINHFAPKMIGFSYNGMMCRLFLAALHFNENSTRIQAVDKDGVLRFRIEFPKYKKGEHIVRKIKVDSTFDYVENLLETVMSMAERSSLTKQRSPTCTLPTVPPPLCNDFHHPRMEDAVAGIHSRFSLNSL